MIWVNCLLRSYATDIYYKNFDILIQYRFSKFFFINKFYFLGSGQSFGGSVGFLGQFLLVKININITEDKEKNAKYYFYTNIG